MASKAQRLREMLEELLPEDGGRRKNEMESLEQELYKDPDEFESNLERMVLGRSRTPEERAEVRFDMMKRKEAGEFRHIEEMSATELSDEMDRLITKLARPQESAFLSPEELKEMELAEEARAAARKAREKAEKPWYRFLFQEGGEVDADEDVDTGLQRLVDEVGTTIRGDPYSLMELRAVREGIHTYPDILFGATGIMDEDELEREKRELTHLLSGVSSQWMGRDPETGRAEFALSPENIGETRPGIVDELLAIPTIAEVWGGTPPEWASEAAARQDDLRAQLREDLEIEDPEGFREHFMEAGGTMLGQVPIPAAWISKAKTAVGLGKAGISKTATAMERLGNLAKRAGLAPVEWLSPIIDPKVTNYLIGSLFGGTIGTLTDEDVEEMTGYTSLEELQDAVDEGDEEATQFLLELMIEELERKAGESATLGTLEMAKGGKAEMTRRAMMKALAAMGAGAGTSKALVREGVTSPATAKAALRPMKSSEMWKIIRQMGTDEDSFYDAVTELHPALLKQLQDFFYRQMDDVWEGEGFQRRIGSDDFLQAEADPQVYVTNRLIYEGEDAIEDLKKGNFDMEDVEGFYDEETSTALVSTMDDARDIQGLDENWQPITDPGHTYLTEAAEEAHMERFNLTPEEYQVEIEKSRNQRNAE